MSEVNTDNSIETEGIPEITLRLQVQETVQAPVDATLTIEGEAADAAAVGAALAALQTSFNTAISALFPVGAIFCSTSSSAPTIAGTWVEITMPATYGDLKDGNRSYTDATGTGTLHFWRRTE